jgi:hypothetical protein
MAMAPQDYKKDERERAGSLIKDKDSMLSGVFNRGHEGADKRREKGDDGEKLETKRSDMLKLEVRSPDGATRSACDKLFDAVLMVLGASFRLDMVNRAAGKVVTCIAKVKDFDNTSTCQYIVSAHVTSHKDLTISIASKEDSATRLRKHEEAVKRLIMKAVIATASS